jgi:hypothetical protein
MAAEHNREASHFGRFSWWSSHIDVTCEAEEEVKAPCARGKKQKETDEPRVEMREAEVQRK